MLGIWGAISYLGMWSSIDELPREHTSAFTHATIVVCGKIQGHTIEANDKFAGFLASNHSDIRAISKPFYIQGIHSFTFAAVGYEGDAIEIEYYNSSKQSYHKMSPPIVIQRNDSINGPNILGSLNDHFLFHMKETEFVQHINIPPDTLTNLGIYIDAELNLNELEGNWTNNDFFFAYNASSLQTDNNFYDAGIEKFRNSHTLYPGKGYWVKVKNGFQYSISGSLYQASTIDIPANSLTNLAITQEINLHTLQTTWTNNDFFFAYNASSLQTDNNFYDAGIEKFRNSHTLYPGKGYWVKVKNGLSIRP